MNVFNWKLMRYMVYIGLLTPYLKKPIIQFYKNSSTDTLKYLMLFSDMVTTILPTSKLSRRGS